jgi:hypothetical protein
VARELARRAPQLGLLGRVPGVHVSAGPRQRDKTDTPAVPGAP